MHGMNGMHGPAGRSKAKAPARTQDLAGGEKAPDPRRWLALIVIDLCLLAVTMDNTILNVALPTIARNLSASGSHSSGWSTPTSSSSPVCSSPPGRWATGWAGGECC